MQNQCLSNEEKNCINSLPLATAYIAYQAFTMPVTPEIALEMGTAWQELYDRGAKK
jgi:hypothetical protein